MSAARKRSLGAACFVGLLLTIVAANATLQRFGLWHVGPFIVASGAVWAGFALTLRDGVDDWLGARWVLVAIVAGAAVSGLVDPSLAFASGAAFALSELCDFAVYRPLRERGRLRAVFASNLVGSVADSWLFLWLAPFPATLNAVAGLVLAKLVVTTLTVAVLGGARWSTSRVSAVPA